MNKISLPPHPAVVAGLRDVVWLTPDGELDHMTPGAAARRMSPDTAILCCHAGMTQRRIGTSGIRAFDLLELFAFVRPARFCLPTPKGLAEALDLPLPGTREAEAETLIRAAERLLNDVAQEGRGDTAAIAWAMGRGQADGGGWPWASYVLAALQSGNEQTPAATDAPHSKNIRTGLRIWDRLPEWEDQAPPPPPANHPVMPGEARARLAELLGTGKGKEKRPEQVEYAGRTSAAFLPREEAGKPRFVLAEAGTGVGKTLGYIAPASLWAEKNGGTVWISTYTRNLQRQLDTELDRLFTDPVEKREKVVVRKGRENYFCILNFDEAVNRFATTGVGGTALGLVARWALASRDGDMRGGDFPAWLADLFGTGLTTDMTDTRGECTYSACAHYGKCFIEQSQRRARHAEIVVANHALVMIQAALGGIVGSGSNAEETALPLRYVFDEGHHIFGAADGAFAAHLSAMEAADLRRWLVGPEEGARTRSRGLKTRVEDMIAGDDRAVQALEAILHEARCLPGPGWGARLQGGEPKGPAEKFLSLVRQQVYARTEQGDGPYSLEADPRPPIEGLLDAAATLETALAKLGGPLGELVGALFAYLDREAEDLDSSTRNRVEAVCRSLERRGMQQIAAWRAMLKSLADDTPADFVDWMSVERISGRDIDLGLHRHYIDPTKPFADAVAADAHGVLVTSATLRDEIGEVPNPLEQDQQENQNQDGWPGALARTGAHHLDVRVVKAAVASPFDYPANTKVLVVGDVRRDDPDQIASAYRELFLAAGGGGLGLFTAINRLRAVHDRLAAPLEAANIPLYAQHVDPLDTGTLIDIFRAEEDACLLGTDAVRDGVDVPGRSLRLIVFDRTPWPRPDILHRARRNAFGGRAYDEMTVRLKLKQAFGRLIRRAGDKGVFVMLDRALPSRLLSAFPKGVSVERVGLADAAQTVRTFLKVHAEND